MRIARRVAPVVLLFSGILLFGCPPEELPPAEPDTLQLTLNEYTVSADIGDIVASAFVTDDAVPLTGFAVQFVLTDALGGTDTQTATTNDAGVAETTFAAVRAAGDGTVQATSQTGQGVTDSQTFTITPGVPASLDLTIITPTDPGTDLEVDVTAGESIAYTVAVEDAHGNTTQGAFNLSTDAPGATYGASTVDDLTVANADPDNTNYELTAILASDPTRTDTENFDIVPAAAFTARILLEPGSAQEGTSVTVEAGASLTLDCFIDDQFGNLRTDNFDVADVTTAATTFAGGSPTITEVMDFPTGGSRFTIGDAGAPLNVLATDAATSCLGTAVAAGVLDGDGALTVQDTTAPANVTIILMTPTRSDRALAPGESATVMVSGDDIVGIDNIQWSINAADPANPKSQNTNIGAPTPGITTDTYTWSVDGGAATFDQVRVDARVQDTSGNATVSAVLRHPVDEVADDPGVANGFFVRTWAINADLANATGLAVDAATQTVFYMKPSAAQGGAALDGTDIVQINAGGGMTTNIATNVGGIDSDSVETPGSLLYSQDFSGMSDLWFTREITGGADRFLTGVNEANGASADLTTDNDANITLYDITVADIDGNGDRMYNVVQDAGVPQTDVRQIDNMGMFANLNAADIAGNVTTPGGITFDAANIYVSDNADGDVLQVDDMGNQAVIATAAAGITDMAFITTAAGNFDDELLATNSNGFFHKVDPAGMASANVCATGFFNNALDVAFDDTATLDFDGDGMADMNIPTSFVLDAANQRIYRVQGF